MAKKATKGAAKSRSGSGKKAGTAVARLSSGRSGGSRSDEGMGEAFIKLLQSPLVAELVAVAATAALAALAEQGFTSGDGSRGKRAGKAVKAAGKAAAAAVGRRLGSEIDEIRKAATGGAKA
jgi:hypothetical protein